MIDLHTHSLFSDGVLLPSELIRMAEESGRTAIGITDHIDISNIEEVLPRIVAVCKELNRFWKIIAIPGAEISHVPPETIDKLAKRARKLGATLILVHGETIVEPVLKGTNRAALEADIDILAHPGLILEEDVILAKRKNIFLEISARKGHSLTNGHVAALAIKNQAGLVFNTDSHQPSDLINIKHAEKIIKGAGISPENFKEVLRNSEKILKKVTKNDPHS